MSWAKNAGAFVNSDGDFYTNEVVKGYYKNHVKVKIINTLYLDSLGSLADIGFPNAIIGLISC